jgi:hypothetical protein
VSPSEPALADRPSQQRHRQRHNEQDQHPQAGRHGEQRDRQRGAQPDVSQEISPPALEVSPAPAPLGSSSAQRLRVDGGQGLAEVGRGICAPCGSTWSHVSSLSGSVFCVAWRIAYRRGDETSLKRSGRAQDAPRPARMTRRPEDSGRADAMPTSGHPAAVTGTRGRPLPPLLGPSQRLRRVLWVAIAICLLPIAASFAATMAKPSNSSFTIRSFEWLRDHGAARIAASIEGLYYSLNAPSTGGPALRALPMEARTTAAVHPRDIIPVIDPGLPGEGVWVPTESWSGPDPPVQIAQFRSDPAYPQMVAGVAWIDPRRTSIVLYPGRLEPSVTLPRGAMEVPVNLRGRLLATFNSGFKLADSNGGFALGGVSYAPMHDGMATLVHYRDGRVDIISWTGGPRVPAGVDYARQNLPLIVTGGRPNPNLNDGPEWGLTLGNAVRVWRSGIGINAWGDLIYAAANDQTVGSLARILTRAGAIRAMQLDINDYWVTFNSYAAPDAGRPTSLLPNMTRPVTRYLSPDDRDFFAVYLK